MMLSIINALDLVVLDEKIFSFLAYVKHDPRGGLFVATEA